MIQKISADRGSFKTLEFGPGLNVLRADKSEGATDRDSRNGAGKTSFVELVHFLFGANTRQRNIFRSPALRDWRFEAEVELAGKLGAVARSGAHPGSVVVSTALLPDASRQLAPRTSLGLKDWKALLAESVFGLPAPATDKPKFEPSFRSLFPYFARRQESGGFQECMKHFTRQPTWNMQVSLSWLLGLDWTVSQRFQEWRERKKALGTLKAAAASGELTRLGRGAAELRTDLAIAGADAQRMKDRLDCFRVHPDYETLEREATAITAEIQDLAAANLADRGLLQDLRASLEEEEEPQRAEILNVFREAGIVLPDLVQRRLKEVERFHRTVLANRRAHLAGEIESANARIADREARKRELDRRRRQIMGILESAGALADYTALREELGRREAKVETLTERLRDAERLETLRTELKAERASATKSLQDDVRERQAVVRDVVLRFEALSRSLYERAGSLTIAASDNGPKFEVRIPAGQSRGIANMQIFCFDLMLMELLAERGKSPGFLIHDSHLFDGVDERQTAQALQLGAKRAEAHGFQYIVTMNTDAIPREGFASGFRIEDHFMDVRLTDAAEDGGLFGVRFD